MGWAGDVLQRTVLEPIFDKGSGMEHERVLMLGLKLDACVRKAKPMSTLT